MDRYNRRIGEIRQKHRHSDFLQYFKFKYTLKLRHFNSGLPVNYVRSITIDENGVKWIGTNHGGLARFDGTNWTTYNMTNEKPTDYQ